MLFNKQLFRHLPKQGIIGDCERTAIACLLDLKPEEVPHFGEKYFDDGYMFNKMEDEFLASMGYARIQIPYCCDLSTFLTTAKLYNPSVYYLLSGQSKTGCNHTVVCCGDLIIWDPSIDDAGIIGPCSDGYYWATYLISERFTRNPNG